MKHTKNLVSMSAVSLLLSACAPVQQNTGQTFALGGPQYGAPQQNTYGYPAANNPLAAAAGVPAELGLVNILVGQLGINQQQALGGVGSIFSVAQQRMNGPDFSQLSNAVPGMDRYLSSAPQQVTAANSSSLLGAAASIMGNQGGTLGTLANLAGSFQSLGMNSNMISQFVPVMLQYVQQQGGAGTMSLLQNALR